MLPTRISAVQNPPNKRCFTRHCSAFIPDRLIQSIESQNGTPFATEKRKLGKERDVLRVEGRMETIGKWPTKYWVRWADNRRGKNSWLKLEDMNCPHLITEFEQLMDSELGDLMPRIFQLPKQKLPEAYKGKWKRTYFKSKEPEKAFVTIKKLDYLKPPPPPLSPRASFQRKEASPLQQSSLPSLYYDKNSPPSPSRVDNLTLMSSSPLQAHVSADLVNSVSGEFHANSWQPKSLSALGSAQDTVLSSAPFNFRTGRYCGCISSGEKSIIECQQCRRDENVLEIRKKEAERRQNRLMPLPAISEPALKRTARQCSEPKKKRRIEHPSIDVPNQLMELRCKNSDGTARTEPSAIKSRLVNMPTSPEANTSVVATLGVIQSIPTMQPSSTVSKPVLPIPIEMPLKKCSSTKPGISINKPGSNQQWKPLRRSPRKQSTPRMLNNCSPTKLQPRNHWPDDQTYAQGSAYRVNKLTYQAPPRVIRAKTPCKSNNLPLFTENIMPSKATKSKTPHRDMPAKPTISTKTSKTVV